MAPTTRSNQQAYCKAINKGGERERRPFHKDKGLAAFIFSTIWKVWVSSDGDGWWWWFERDREGNSRDSSLIWGFFSVYAPELVG